MTEIRRLCVFCGSNPGARSEYAAAARLLGQAMVARGIELVYGGGRVGLMGTIADAVLAAGGRVVGIIPQHLADLEVAHDGVSELRVVASMHERKALMFDLSDGFIAMPGGIGTLEELFEMTTWAQLGLHGYPIGLLNVSGFYDQLISFIDHTVSEGFVRPGHRSILVVETEAKALLDRMAAHEPAVVEKWIDRDST